MRRSILNNQVVIFITALVIAIVNILSTTHFILLAFMGVAFYIFKLCYINKFYYSLLGVVITFIVIEVNQNMPMFSLLVISLMLIIFILPLFKQLFSIEEYKNIFDLVVFYISVISVNYFINGIFIFDVSSFLLNIALDIIIIGLFL